MFQTLTIAGFTQHEAEIYVFIEDNKPQNVANIKKALNFNKRMIYRIIKKFKQMGIATATGDRHAYYTVMPFDALLDLLKNVSTQQADALQARKTEILSLWHANLDGKSEH